MRAERGLSEVQRISFTILGLLRPGPLAEFLPRFVGVAALLLGLGTTPHCIGQTMSEDWERATKADLDVMRSTIVEAHPGVIDAENPSFQDWLHEGYRQAISLAKKVANRSDSLAVLRFYAQGFKDGHLVVYETHRPLSQDWSGWIAEKRGQDFYVAYTASEWPVPLPPVGSKILSCDGDDVRTILARDVAPYYDSRLDLDSTWYKLAEFLTVHHNAYPSLSRPRQTACRVMPSTGQVEIYPLHWEHKEGSIRAGRRRVPARQDVRNLGEGVYWLRLNNFQPGPSDAPQLKALVERLKRINDAKIFVLDTRGNNGGDSAVGQEILGAIGIRATPPERGAVEPAAFWRASALARDTLAAVLVNAKEVFGADSKNYRWIASMHESVTSALSEGQPWVPQPPDPLRPSHTEDFRDTNSRLILVTDAWCASACLDFADEVLSVPGAVHLGLPTGADSVYLDVGTRVLPSGLNLSVPLKVWRNRHRGNNQPYVPSQVFDGDINDDGAVEAWVLPIARRSLAA